MSVATGVGLVRAYQKALDSNKDICLVLRHDGKGNVNKIGYRLKNKGMKEFPKETNWFEKNEIKVLVNSAELQKLSGEIELDLDIDIEFIPPKKLEEKGRELLILFHKEEARFRNIIRFKKKKVLEFVIQLEIKAQKANSQEWRPYVRYDCAHGYIHRDLIYANGRREKARIATQILEDAIQIIIQDLQLNFRWWFRKLGYDKISVLSSSWSTLEVELEDAKEFLFSLIRNPEKIPQMSSVHRLVGVERFKREERQSKA